MNTVSYLNSKIKKMDWLDLALVKFSCVAFGILLVILFPELVYGSPLVIAVLVVLLAIRPAYRVYIDKESA